MTDGGHTNLRDDRWPGAEHAREDRDAAGAGSTIRVQESAIGTGGWTEVPASRLEGGPLVLAAGHANTVQKIGVRPNARYIRVVYDHAANSTVGGIVVLGYPRTAPVS